MQLLQSLRNEARKIAADIENSKLFTNMGDRGAFREAIVANFLRPFLPECYGLSNGEVFAADGSQSAQVDIVIYDAVFSTVLFKNGPCQLFPAESVFGSIEVKSNLTMDEFRTDCDKIASLKQLPRSQADQLQFLPHVHFDANPAVFSYGGRATNPYVGFIFGYRGIGPEAIGAELDQRLRERPEKKQLLPDFVFVAQPGYVLLRCTNNAVAPPGHDFTRFAHLNIGDDALPFFFVTMNACLSQLRLKGIDYSSFWSQYFTELLTRPADGKSVT
jgi:hypothetical protein